MDKLALLIGVYDAVLLSLEKESIRTVAELFEPEVVKSIVSPSEKPASTILDPAVIVVDVTVDTEVKVVFRAIASISRFILLARACTVSVTLPTFLSRLAMYTCAPLEFPLISLLPSSQVTS